MSERNRYRDCVGVAPRRFTLNSLGVLGAALALTLGGFPAGAQGFPVPSIAIERFWDGSRPTSGLATSAGVNAEYVSWTMPAGVQYTGVTITADLAGVGGTGAGTAYLYSAPGASGTLFPAATLVAANSVSVSGNVPDFAPTGLFTNVTLGSPSGLVTYYLVLVPSNSFLTWYTSNAATTITGLGITANPDQGASAVASPPSGSTWTALSPNGLLFNVFTFSAPSVATPVPTLSGFGLFGAAMLLGLAGWLLGKRRSAAFFAVLLLCQVGFCQTAQGRFAASRVLVKFRDTFGVTSTIPNDIIGTDDVAVSRPVGGAGAFLLQSRSQSTAALLSSLTARPDVMAVAPDYIIQTSNTPNDDLYGQQWALPMISAPSAWNTSTGSRNSVVAVLDTGIDYTHLDLNANIWTAPSSFTVTIAGQQITCPAGSHGFTSLADASGNLVPTCDPQEGIGNFSGHGTMLGGIIGAVGNNSIGVAGVNWTASVMGLRMAGNPALADQWGCSPYNNITDLRIPPIAREILITDTSGWGGSSLQPGYRLTPLADVADYLHANGRLPGIRSQAELQQTGIGVGELQGKLLAKIEESTLHLIQTEERSDGLERQNRALAQHAWNANAPAAQSANGQK